MWLPRTWNLEGSENNTDWIILKEHKNDPTMQGATVYMFNLSNWTEAFRYFRLHLTGPDSSGTNYVGISSFELFGRVSGNITNKI